MSKPIKEKSVIEFSQEGDSNQDNPDVAQEIKIETANAGGGDYYVISTTRWAFDNLMELTALFKDIPLRREKDYVVQKKRQ